MAQPHASHLQTRSTADKRQLATKATQTHDEDWVDVSGAAVFKQEWDNFAISLPIQIFGGRTIAGRAIGRGYWQKDANGRAVVFPVLPAFNLDLAPVAFNKLLRDKQADARAYGAASGEEGFKHPWQIGLCDAIAVILNGQDDAI